MINIALPKINFVKKSLNLLFSGIEPQIDSEKLNFSNNGYNFVFLKRRDIPKLIERGYFQLGVTSEEWLIETNIKLKILKVFNWCDTRICLIAKNKNFSIYDPHQKVNCVTEFPEIARNYFKQHNVNNANIITVFGSSEGMVDSIFNCCIDCIETGKTIESNQLYEIEVILHSKVVLVTQNGCSENFESIVKTIFDF